MANLKQTDHLMLFIFGEVSGIPSFVKKKKDFLLIHDSCYQKLVFSALCLLFLWRFYSTQRNDLFFFVLVKLFCCFFLLLFFSELDPVQLDKDQSRHPFTAEIIKLEIWPEKPSYFAAAVSVHCQRVDKSEGTHQWGGGVTSPQGGNILTRDLTGNGEGSKREQRSRRS